MTEHPVDWAGYLARYHDAHPGITERLLADARDGAGRTPYDWLIEAVGAAGTVVDVACGSSPVARRFDARRTVGVDPSPGELGEARRASPDALLARADAAALPLAAGVADAVTISMALMLLPLDGVLAEAARVLRPGGLLAATIPTRFAGGDALRAPVFGEILAQLGQASCPYPEPLERSSLAGRFSRAGFELREDTAGLFVRIVAPGDADLVVHSFYAPETDADRVAEAIAMLRRRTEAAPVEVGYPIRRIVAVSRS